MFDSHTCSTAVTKAGQNTQDYSKGTRITLYLISSKLGVFNLAHCPCAGGGAESLPRRHAQSHIDLAGNAVTKPLLTHCMSF